MVGLLHLRWQSFLCKFKYFLSKDHNNQQHGNNYHAQQQPPPYSITPVSSVITQQPTTVFVQSIQVGPTPIIVTCPQCQNTVTTSIDYESSGRTHVTAALLCLFGFWPCLWIPYCTPCCRNTTHNCSRCGGENSNPLHLQIQ